MRGGVFVAAILLASVCVAEVSGRNTAVCKSAVECFVTDTSTVCGVPPLTSDRPVLIVFTASWCAPCRMMMSDLFNRPEISALLERLDLVLLDVDDPASQPYRDEYCPEYEGPPHMILLDMDGNRIDALAGYHKDSRVTTDFLEKAFGESSASEEPVAVSDMTRRYLEWFATMKPTFMDRLSMSRWMLGFEAGAAFSQIAASEYGGFRTGFYVAASTGYIFSDRWSLNGGLSFNSLGGRNGIDDTVIRSYYMSLPVDVQYDLGRVWIASGIALDFLVSAGVYGSVMTGLEGACAACWNRWDAGVRARLVFRVGSFDLSLGYMRGLVPTNSAGGYNQSIGVGLGINLF